MQYKMRYSAAFALAALTFLSQPSYAYESSMTFSFQREDYRKYGLGLYQIIHANGSLNEGTVDRLKVFAEQNNIAPGGEIYFNSSTGNRLEGMRLGRLIRKLGLITRIGDTDTKKSGLCANACAFAYLGGTHRFMNASATYSVHNFYRSQGDDQEFTLQEAQATSQAMIDYMREMGVSTTLFRYMAVNTQDDNIYINKQTLITLGVVDDGIIQSSWKLDDNDGVPYMRGELEDYKGSYTLNITCDTQFATLKGSGVIKAGYAEDMAPTATQEGMILDDTKVATKGELAMSAQKVTYDFAIPPDMARRIADASAFGLYVQPKAALYSAMFQIPHTLQSKGEMKKYIDNCFSSQRVKQK